MFPKVFSSQFPIAVIIFQCDPWPNHRNNMAKVSKFLYVHIDYRFLCMCLYHPMAEMAVDNV